MSAPQSPMGALIVEVMKLSTFITTAGSIVEVDEDYVAHTSAAK